MDKKAKPPARHKTLGQLRSLSGTESQSPRSQSPRSSSSSSQQHFHPSEIDWLVDVEKEISSLPPLSRYCQVDNHQKQLELILLQILRTMGLSETNIQSTLESVRENAVVPSRYILDVRVQQSLSSLAVKVFAPYLREQVYLSKVIRVQAHSRGWLVRRMKDRYHKTYRALGLEKRLSLFQKIVKFQRGYVQDLFLFTSSFFDSLARKGSLVSEEEMFALFGNLPQILKFNQSIYLELLRYREKDWPFVDGFSSVFWTFRESMRDYLHAAANFQYQRETFERLLLKSKFVSVLESCIPGARVYVPKIFERVVNWTKAFLHLLEEYLSEIPASQTLLNEVCGLKEIIVCLRLLKGNVEEQLSQSPEKARIRNVLRRVTAEGFFLEDILMNDHERRYLREGEVLLIDNKNKNKRYFFLFSDLLLLTKPSGHSDTFKMSSGNAFWLDRTTLVESEVEGDAPQGSKKEVVLKSLTLHHEATKVTIACSVEAEVFIWIAKINQQIQLNHQLFGIPLEEVLSREPAAGSRVPSIVSQCISFLEENGVYQPDIFLRPGNSHTIATLRKSVCLGRLPDFTSTDPYSVASFLEDYLNSLPEPLLTSSLCDYLTGENLETVKILDIIHKDLPACNRHLIEVIVLFLLRLCPLPGNNINLEAISSKFQSILFRTKLDLPRSQLNQLTETISLKIFRSYELIASSFGLIAQANESSNSFVNAQAKARCSLSYTKFAMPNWKSGAKEFEGTTLKSGGNKTVNLDGARKKRSRRLSRKLHELTDINQDAPTP